MKQLILIMTMALAGSLANAKTTCSVSRSTNHNETYDQLLFNAEITGPKYIVIKAGADRAEDFAFGDLQEDYKLRRYGKIKALNGATLITFGAASDDAFGITSSTFDFSKANALPIDAMAIGPIPTGRFLLLIVPSKSLSISCQQAD